MSLTEASSLVPPEFSLFSSPWSVATTALSLVFPFPWDWLPSFLLSLKTTADAFLSVLPVIPTAKQMEIGVRREYKA